MKKTKSLSLCRGFFFKSLLCLILFLYLNIFNIKPVYGFTTLNQCAADPVCASTMLTKTAAKEVVKKSSINLAKQTTTKTVVNLTTGQAKKTTISSLGKKGFIFGVGAKLADLVFGHLVDDGIDVIQDKIMDYYNETTGSDFCRYEIWYTYSEGGRFKFSSNYIGRPNLFTSFEESSTISGFGDYFIYSEDGSYSSSFYGRYRGEISLDYPLLGDCQAFTDWDDIPDDKKDEAIDQYFEDKPTEAFEDLIDTTPIELPDYQPGDELFIDDDDGGQKVTVPEDESNENPDDSIEPTDPEDPKCTNPDLAGYDPDHANCQPPTDPDPKDCPSEDSPDYDPNNSDCVEKEEEEDPEVECIECEVDAFTDKNFFVYAQEKFITEPKFPFDIFGDLPSAGSSNQCPTVELFDRSKELCFVNESIATLKYPVWIGWMFKLVFHL